MDKKNKTPLIYKILTFLFIIFLSLYLMTKFGYYNTYTKNTIITEEKMKEFESDIANGNKIDIKNYIENDIDYTNKYSNFGYKLSNIIEVSLEKVIDNLSKILKKLFE